MTGETVADRRVHPATVPLHFLKSAPSLLLGLPAGLAIMSKSDLAELLGFAAAIAGVALFAYWLSWRRFRYGLGAHELVIESGIMTRNRRSIPFDRIQDVDIERGPLQRLFGLAKVRIETGGGAGEEGVIDSVSVAEADALRAAVRAGRRGEPTRIAVAEEEPVGRTIFAMSITRVLVAGLFNFSLVYIAGLFGLLQTFKDFLPFDIYDPGRWLGLVDGRLSSQIRNGALSAGAILAVLLVALLAGVLFGVARTVAADYGFRLTVKGIRFRRTRGLLTRSEIVLAKSRVQLALLRSGPLRRAGGWGALSFQTLSGATATGERQSVAPLAKDVEVDAILAEQGDLARPDPAALTMVSSRHLLRTFVRVALLPSVAIGLVTMFWRPASFAFALMPLLVTAALFERRFHRYALGSELMFITRGIWHQQLWMIPVSRIQSVTLTRGFLQRRLGLASVLIDTAGGTLLGGPRIVDLRIARACALIDDLARYSGRKSGTER